MISFKQYLTELFDKPYTWSKSGNGNTYGFRVGENSYGVRFNDIDPMGNYEIDFFIGKPGRSGYALVGSKTDATRIYSTLIDITKDWLGSHRFTSLTFVPDSPRTVNLYTKYAKWVTKQTNSAFRTINDPFRNVPAFEIIRR